MTDVLVALSPLLVAGGGLLAYFTIDLTRSKLKVDVQKLRVDVQALAQDEAVEWIGEQRARIVELTQEVNYLRTEITTLLRRMALYESGAASPPGFVQVPVGVWLAIRDAAPDLAAGVTDPSTETDPAR